MKNLKNSFGRKFLGMLMTGAVTILLISGCGNLATPNSEAQAKKEAMDLLKEQMKTDREEKMKEEAAKDTEAADDREAAREEAQEAPLAENNSEEEGEPVTETPALEEEADTPVEAPQVVADTSGKYKRGSKFPSFTTIDIYGNEVSSSLFAENKITVVNIWGTFCGPCINEMPELGEWNNRLPEGVGLVGIVCDINGPYDIDTMDYAGEIVDYTGAHYVNLVPDSGLWDILNYVDAVPTTIFVDAEGYIVGDYIVGAYVAGYKDFVSGYLASH